MKVLICFALVGVSFALASVKLHPLSDEVINHINSRKSTWRAGRNFESNTSLSQIRGLLGTFDSPERTLKTKVHTFVEHLSIPDAFDARDHWPKCASIGEIRDQAACGSCWAVGAAEAMSDRICIHSNGEKRITVSAEDLLSCCGLTCGFGCGGGFTDAAWRYWVNNGIVSGGEYGTITGCKAYPFSSCAHNMVSDDKPSCTHTGYVPMCIKACDKDSTLLYDDDLTFGASAYYIEEDERQVRLEIMTNGPVEASYVVYEDFLHYKSGVYQHIYGSELGGHAIKILGWGIEYGVPYWLVANSWNADWGDGGYFKIVRGWNEAGIESNVIAGLPKL